MTNDDHLPAEGQVCERCQPGPGDHLICWDTELDLADANPKIALHDAAFRVTGEAA